MSEIQLQAKIFQYFWNNHPKTRGLIFHVPNGGKRNMIEATQLKASGVIPGIPDLMILRDGKAYGLELKRDEGKYKVSADQIKLHGIWKENNIPVYVCDNYDGALLIINNIFEL
jgi:hypothetical protein